MPRSCPVSTSPSANGSAAANITPAAKTKIAAIENRRWNLLSDAIAAAGPTNTRSISGGDREDRNMYIPNSPNITPVSISERWPRRGC